MYTEGEELGLALHLPHLISCHHGLHIWYHFTPLRPRTAWPTCQLRLRGWEIIGFLSLHHRTLRIHLGSVALELEAWVPGSALITFVPFSSAVKTAFRWCLDSKLMRKHHLISTEDYYTDPVPFCPAPKGNLSSLWWSSGACLPPHPHPLQPSSPTPAAT